MTFAQPRNRLTTHFSERISVVKRRISVPPWCNAMEFDISRLESVIFSLFPVRTITIRNITSGIVFIADRALWSVLNVLRPLKGCLFFFIRRRNSFARWTSLWLIKRTKSHVRQLRILLLLSHTRSWHIILAEARQVAFAFVTVTSSSYAN